MNFVAWFANVLIDFFGFEADMPIGISVILGIFVLFTLIVLFSVSLVNIMIKMGWIKDEME